MWYLVGLAAIVGGAMLVRKYLYSKPIGFAFEGERYTRHPDGRFTTEAGEPVAEPRLAAVKAHWDEINEVSLD